jgi:hypothetical protein
LGRDSSRIGHVVVIGAPPKQQILWRRMEANVKSTEAWTRALPGRLYSIHMRQCSFRTQARLRPLSCLSQCEARLLSENQSAKHEIGSNTNTSEARSAHHFRSQIHAKQALLTRLYLHQPTLASKLGFLLGLTCRR